MISWIRSVRLRYFLVLFSTFMFVCPHFERIGIGTISSFLLIFLRCFGSVRTPKRNRIVVQHTRGKDVATLWKCGVFATLWCIWTQRNSRIFDDQRLTKGLSGLSCFALVECFRCVPRQSHLCYSARLECSHNLIWIKFLLFLVLVFLYFYGPLIHLHCNLSSLAIHSSFSINFFVSTGSWYGYRLPLQVLEWCHNLLASWQSFCSCCSIML